MTTISYNEEMEMMVIRNNDKTVFFGNYWDFSTDPISIAELLKSLGLEVEIKDDYKPN